MDAGRYCIPYSSLRGCFRDTCYGDKLTYSMECANCTSLADPAGTSGFSEQCKADVPLTTAGTTSVLQGICFDVKGWPKERACCTFKISATDPCGNTATIYDRLCVFGRGMDVPSGCQQLKPWTSIPTAHRVLQQA